MDGALKLWKCKNDHVLGYIERVQATHEGKKYHVTQLMLFRQALEEEPEPCYSLVAGDVIARIEGTVKDIHCSRCGAVRTWWMGEAALERMLGMRDLAQDLTRGKKKEGA